jgi:hypothetical protein
MSALDHKRTLKRLHPMSVLPPKADAHRMSALCQEQTSTGANTSNVQIGRKSIAELITGRIGMRALGGGSQ